MENRIVSLNPRLLAVTPSKTSTSDEKINSQFCCITTLPTFVPSEGWVQDKLHTPFMTVMGGINHDAHILQLLDARTKLLMKPEQISKLRASQSPIAISVQRCPTWSSLDPLKFKGYWDNQSNGTLINTGQTAYFTFDTENRPRLSGGPLIGEYIFEQMHFHWSVDDFTGCEHVLDGHGYAAECHLVHYNSKYQSLEAAVAHSDGLAVVGYLLEAVDAPNPSFDKFVEGLENIKKPDNNITVSAESLSWMDKEDVTSGSYVTYKGSLTTPPFTECVTWIIYEKPVQIGSEQLGLLRQLEGMNSVPIERNVRPTQRHPPGHSVIYVKQMEQESGRPGCSGLR